MLASIRKVQSFFLFSHEIIFKAILKSGFKFVHFMDAVLYIIKALIQKLFFLVVLHTILQKHKEII